MIELTTAEHAVIDPLVQKYVRNRDIIDAIAKVAFDTIQESQELRAIIHSVKFRSKDPGHLSDKLARKFRKTEEGQHSFDVSVDNLFSRINDLAGVRILHLHTAQITDIDSALLKCFAAKNFNKIEGPTAKTWDDEYRRYFESINFGTEVSKNQYTSVHYVFDTGNDLGMTIEVQVRTLAEELWGEVDHSLNYPHKHASLACTEQIAVLARVTSSCTRLVDSIIRSDAEHRDREKKGSRSKKRMTKQPAPSKVERA